MRPSFTMYGDHWPKFWIRPDLDRRVVDVDPVVGEPGRLGHDERHRDEVAVAQPVGRGDDVVGRRRVHRAQERTDRHRRDDVGALVAGGCAAGDGGDRRRLAAAVLDLRDGGVEDDLRPLRRHDLRAALPHHPGAVLGVVELLDQARDLLRLRGALPHPLGLDRLPDGTEQRQVLDALRAPIGLDLGAGDAPDLLALGLEEVAVQAPAEPRGHEPLERRLVLRRVDAHPQVRAHAAHRLDRTEVLRARSSPRSGSRRTCRW